MAERIETEVVIYPTPSATPGLEGTVVRTDGPFAEQMRRQGGSPEARRAEQERRAQERAEAARNASHVLTMNDLRTWQEPLPPPSLKVAAERIATEGGRLELDADDRLLVIVPGMTEGVRAPARMLYACEQVVVDHLRRGAELPDSPVTPAGALISEPKAKGKRG